MLTRMGEAGRARVVARHDARRNGPALATALRAVQDAA